MPTFTEAYRQAGYTLKNPRNQWSAVSEKGQVAITVWSDEIDKTQEPWVIDNRNAANFDAWGNRTGNSLRRKHIAHALQQCGGEVDLILCVAVDPTAEPRKVKHASSWPERIGDIDEKQFNSATGQFRMELRPRSGNET